MTQAGQLVEVGRGCGEVGPLLSVDRWDGRDFAGEATLADEVTQATSGRRRTFVHLMKFDLAQADMELAEAVGGNRVCIHK